jgi:DNA polymerase-3 subunit alpha
MSEVDYDSFLRFKVYHRSKLLGFPMTQDHVDRIEYELAIIKQLKYASYFLIIADLCDFMTRKGILFIARGSGCGSTVIWRLGVSHRWLDPIEYNIPFERFLNPERISMPDIDIDMQDDRRDEVFQYSIEKYGADCVSKVVTFGTMAAKAAVKDTFRGLGYHDYEKTANEITMFIPGGKGADGKNVRLRDAIRDSEKLKEFQGKYPEAFDFAMKVEGKIRNASIHACATIIAPDRITKFMPTVFWGNPEDRSPDEKFPTTQFDMYDAEERGHLKMDYLGLKTLRVISHTEKAINIIRKIRGLKPDFSIHTVERRDPRTFKLLADGKTACVFQIEKQFVRNYAKRMNMMKMDPWQLAVLVAIIRPGMMDASNGDGGVSNTEHYLLRASGQEEAKAPHPLLQKILEPTLGMLCFQEDVMWVARILCNFTMGKADVLRKGVGKKAPEFIAKMKPDFDAGAKANGVSQDDIDKIWAMIEAHSRYSFNNAHAAAYGMVISYWTAYLKANWPLPFMMNMINSESGTGNKEDGYNFKVAEYVEEARSMGIRIHPPCVRRSHEVCSIDIDENSIRFGLSLIKKMSKGGVAWIRQHACRAKTFKEFVMHGFEIRPDAKGNNKPYSKISKTDFEVLILAGAMDVFENGDRAKMLSMLPKVMDLAEKYLNQWAKEQQKRRVNLKSEDVKQMLIDYQPDQYDERTLEQRLQDEQSVTGCYLSDSPFQPYRDTIDACCNCSPDEILEGETNSETMVFAGILTKLNEVVVKKGKNAGAKMGFLGFTGLNGSSLECTAFVNAYAALHAGPAPVEKGKVYIVGVKRDRDGIGILLEKATRLSNCGFAS